jgi:hypothetical protein
MDAEAYLEYLIGVACSHAKGDTSIGVQPSELATLKTLFRSEKAQLTLKAQFVAKVNRNGNPA